jgi:dienelactone hydrolase
MDYGPPPGADDEELEIRVLQVGVTSREGDVYSIVLQTTRGDVPGVFHVVQGGIGATVMVCGASGGLEGPAEGIYERLAEGLADRGITSLRLDYREAGEFAECVMDVLAGASFLKGLGAERIAFIGHSFGGAVMVKAAEIAGPHVVAVAALSSQGYGTQNVERLERPLLVVHGMMDQVIEATTAESIYARAHDPKRIVLYAEAGHSLDQAKADLYDLLIEWVPEHVIGEASQQSTASGQR